ncbi:MAG: excisionase [Clostridia bacterium]|nr:excisionase [Clostridia bacterium]
MTILFSVAHFSKRYYHIGEGKLRMLIDQNPHEDFYVMNGNRALIKREKFERYLDQATAV